MIHRTVCSKVHHIDGASGISANPLTVLAALFAMALLGAALTSPAIADDDPPAAEAAAADHDKDAGHKDGDHEAGDHDEEGDGADGHGGHGDDPATGDLGHANATPSLEAAEEWKFDLAIFTFIVFLLLMGILLKFAWGPIMEALNNREARIATLIDEAEASATRAKEELAAYEAKLAEAHVEADKIVTQAKVSAQEQSDALIAEAREAAQRERDRAVAEIELAKNEALGEVTQRSVDIALGLARNVVGREIRAEDHDQLIQEALAKFPSS